MFVIGEDDIQGAIAIQEHEDNQLIHIELMEAAPHNKYSNPNQTHTGIGKSLLCLAMDLSFQLKYEGFIGLFAKRTKMKYITKILVRPRQDIVCRHIIIFQQIILLNCLINTCQEVFGGAKTKEFYL